MTDSEDVDSYGDAREDMMAAIFPSGEPVCDDGKYISVDYKDIYFRF